MTTYSMGFFADLWKLIKAHPYWTAFIIVCIILGAFGQIILVVILLVVAAIIGATVGSGGTHAVMAITIEEIKKDPQFAKIRITNDISKISDIKLQKKYTDKLKIEMDPKKIHDLHVNVLIEVGKSRFIPKMTEPLRIG